MAKQLSRTRTRPDHHLRRKDSQGPGLRIETEKTVRSRGPSGAVCPRKTRRFVTTKPRMSGGPGQCPVGATRFRGWFDRKSEKIRKYVGGNRSVKPFVIADFVIKCSHKLSHSRGAPGSLTSFGFEWYSEPNILGQIGSPFPWVN